jgi:integrase/recombinase XerD
MSLYGTGREVPDRSDNMLKAGAKGGVKGASSHSGRRTMASRLLDQSHDLETLRLMPGHAELDHVAPYLQVDKKKLRQAFADVL